MKRKTKELIEKMILDYEKNDLENKKEKIAFLKSLQLIENQLKRGGFIPDRNKKPCKDGDKIMLFLKNDLITKDCFLRWDPKDYYFYFEAKSLDEFKVWRIGTDGEFEFEKIESGAVDVRHPGRTKI